MTGKDCDIKNFSKDFEIVRNINDKKEGRQHYHIVQSFNQKETTQEKAHQIGVEFANFEKFKGYQVAIVTHKDKEHIHNHIVINAVSFETGLKFQQSKSDLYRMRDFSDRLCIENGLSIIEKKENPGQVRAYQKDKYQVIKKAFEGKGKSYLVDTALAVEKSLEKSTSKHEFVLQMNERGYKTIWTEERKNITFENSEGKKVRLSNLEKTFSDNKYTKKGLESEFKRVDREKETRRTEQSKEQLKFDNRTGTQDIRDYIEQLNNDERVTEKKRDDKIAERENRDIERVRHNTLAEQRTREEEQRVREEFEKNKRRIRDDDRSR